MIVAHVTGHQYLISPKSLLSIVRTEVLLHSADVRAKSVPTFPLFFVTKCRRMIFLESGMNTALGATPTFVLFSSLPSVVPTWRSREIYI